MSTHPTPIRILGAGATAGIADAVAKHLNAKRIFLLCDDNTWSAAGEQVQTLLANHYAVTVQSLGRQVRPSLSAASAVAEQIVDSDAVIAVGSGTINDIAKYAAAQAGKPYAVVATAATMNGYTSANASLEKDGHKQSFAARAPVFVLGDTTILNNAPKRLMHAGLGDTLCRTTVEADMLLSHHLLGTPYPRELFDKLRHHEPVLLAGSMNAPQGDTAFITTLFNALLDAGDAMTSYGSSAPASQGEHMIAHTLELKYGSELHGAMHGELIALTSITMSQFQHRALLSTPTLRALPYSSDNFERLFGRKHAAALCDAYKRKCLTVRQADEANTRLAGNWPDIWQEISQIMLPTTTLERAFIHSGIKTKPQQLGLDEERYRFATSYAHLTRDRFTFLDLAAMGAQRAR